MQLVLPGAPHLTYCSNVHPGESLEEIEAILSEATCKVKARVSPDAPMGIGLRLSAKAAAKLSAPDRLERLSHLLREKGLYVFTINAFPYGPFHGQTVKEKVYEPDWRRPERLAYSNQCADILAALLPDGGFGSVSTVPGGFKTAIRSPDDRTLIVDQMIRHAAHLHGIAERRGQTIALAIEPEPCCLLETTAEAIAFFRDELFCTEAITHMQEMTGLGSKESKEAMMRHLGLCFDVCHAAVEFEDVRASLGELRIADINIPKLQLSSALAFREVLDGAAERLAAFDDGVYLHQAVTRRKGELTRYTDLPEMFDAMGQAALAEEWRVHFHVPVFLDHFEGVDSTQHVLKEVLSLCRQQPISPHLEIETYTWTVLPAALRQAEVAADIAREIQWVRSQLQA